jgi:cell division protein FtsB
MRYSELQREKQALEDKVEKYEAEVEKLEYLIDSPIDYDYIVRVAREKLNLYLPNEIIYHNDTNK